ncbi:polymer-forming cytoskeletal protein [Desulfovibrio desulfuricans]|uniref:Polymer-forming cytoskeletal protein n=1 Tax=Desulfovibrio desulfuricans TaxID=876 RepID=A0A4P7UP35_DESDE|nr:polymer-forming cytoskeletal protein [Desulfovibrio desulfuricans]QCC86684.1 polymer-forming cytoskeletal protein [Desulfovibrio desulfuricans]
MAKDEIAYLGSDTVYEGKLHFKGTVRIEGRYTGEIVSDGTLNVGKDAQVQGTLDVGELLLSGRFSGEVTAKRRVVVYSSGVLEGQLATPNLLTEEGGIIEGQISMKGPAKPKA